MIILAVRYVHKLKRYTLLRIRHILTYEHNEQQPKRTVDKFTSKMLIITAVIMLVNLSTVRLVDEENDFITPKGDIFTLR